MIKKVKNLKIGDIVLHNDTLFQITDFPTRSYVGCVCIGWVGTRSILPESAKIPIRQLQKLISMNFFSDIKLSLAWDNTNYGFNFIPLARRINK